MEKIIASGIEFVWKNTGPVVSWLFTAAATALFVGNIFPSLSDFPLGCLSWLSATVWIGLSYPYPRVQLAIGPLSVLAVIVYLVNWPTPPPEPESYYQVWKNKIKTTESLDFKNFIALKSLECKNLRAEESRFKSIRAVEGVWLTNVYACSLAVSQGVCCIWTNEKLMEFPVKFIVAGCGVVLTHIACSGLVASRSDLVKATNCYLEVVKAVGRATLINSKCNTVFLEVLGEEALLRLEKGAVIGDVFVAVTGANPDEVTLKIEGEGSISRDIHLMGFKGRVHRSEEVAFTGQIRQTAKSLAMVIPS